MARWVRGRRLLTPVAGIAAGLVCFACEGGKPNSSGGNGPGGNDDDDAPVAAIQFPPSGGLTDAAQVNLVIAAVDETAVAAVRAGGVLAVLDSDSLWKVSVPLQAGNNTILVETRDSRGNSNPTAAQLSIRRENALWVDPVAVAFDVLVGEVLVLDPPQRALYGVQPLTGLRTLRAGPGLGSGPLFPNARDMDFVPSRHAAVVTDGQLDAVILVDLTSGVRTTLSSPGTGGGPTPLDLHGIVVDEARNRVLVLDDGRSELMAVNLSTGERSTVSSDFVGGGPSLIGPRRVALDLVRNRALVSVALSRAILAVDLGNGNRSVLSAGGPGVFSPFDLVVDPFRDRAIVVDPEARTLFDVTLATGARQVFSGAAVGDGPAWLRPEAVALHLSGVPLVVDSSLDTLVEVGAVSGDRRLLSGFTQGTGTQFVRPASMVSGLSTPDRFVVADPRAVIGVVIANGGRLPISGGGLGSGAPFVELADVGVSQGTPTPCLDALDAGLPGVWSINRFTGERTLISSNSLGSGPEFSRPRRMTLEPNPNLTGCALTALVLDKPLGEPAVILRVDLLTGARSVLADDTHGLGPELKDPVAIELDAARGVANVLDARGPAILAVDLVTGDRSPILQLPAVPGTPTDLHFDASRNRFLVAVAEPSALLLADLDAQTTTILSDVSKGAGPVLGRPVALELRPSATVDTVASTPIAYVLDASRGSILAVDTSSGDRVIQSK